MNVYLVIEDVFYEGDRVCSVHLTRAGARRALKDEISGHDGFVMVNLDRADKKSNRSLVVTKMRVRV